MKNEAFWNACANSVNKTCNSSRTGSSCPSRVNKHLMKKFKSLSEAEEALNIDYVLKSGNSEETCDNTQPPRLIPEDVSLSPIFSCSPSKYTQPPQS